MSGAYSSEDSYNCIPPAGLGIENGGITNQVQTFYGEKTFAGNARAVLFFAKSVLFDPASTIQTSLATISAFNVNLCSELILTNAGAITLNSLLLDNGNQDYSCTILMHFNGAGAVTIKHNTPLGGIPFYCPNNADYVIPATSKNKIFVLRYSQVAGAFYVS